MKSKVYVIAKIIANKSLHFQNLYIQKQKGMKNLKKWEFNNKDKDMCINMREREKG